MTKEQILNDFFEYNLSYTPYDPNCDYPENEFALKLVFNEIMKEKIRNPCSDYHMVFNSSFSDFKKLVDTEYSKWLAA